MRLRGKPARRPFYRRRSVQAPAPAIAIGPARDARKARMAGKLTISIDLELAWGVWDHLTPQDLRLAESAERPICAALIDLFDRHAVPATWAVVAALLDEPSAAARPGANACWFAPDIVERLMRNKAGHEIGSHS